MVVLGRRSSRSSRNGALDAPPTQLQPLVVPQLGQAWQEPARCITTPHCMHIGASWLTVWASNLAVRVVEVCTSATRLEADSTDGGSAGRSEP